MNYKRILLLCLILSAFLMANPFSLELSLSGGLQHLYTNDRHFSNDREEVTAVSSDIYIIHPSLKTESKILYKNTGLYISAQKPFGGYKFKKYYIISGGLIQRVPLSEKASLDIYAGTTWHSVNEAIHSFTEFLIYTHFTSELVLDAVLNYNYRISNNLYLTAGINYNYNRHYNDSVCIDYYYKYKFQTISLNAGIMFSLKQRHSD